jgi:Na+-translocating ferredoxin:NAD+ oxidoreductase RnfC subunit
MYHDGYQSDRLVEEVLEKRQIQQNIKLCSECSSCSVICRRGLDMKAQIRMAQEVLVHLPAAGREFGLKI